MELLISYVVLAVISAGFFGFGRVLGARFPDVSVPFCALALVFGWLMCWIGGGALRWGLLVPPGMSYLCSYSPALLVVGAAGMLSVIQSVRWRNRYLLSIALCGAVAALFLGVLLRPHFRPVQLAHQTLWQAGACLQSHESSCVPAAVTSLLHLHQIKCEERTMAALAHTSRDGTPPLGSYLALSRAVQGKGLRARILLASTEFPTAAELPILAHVHFSEEANVPSLTAQFCWKLLQGIQTRNQGHAVVIIERCGKNWLISDPAAGHVEWSDEQLRERWNHEGVYLARQ